MLLISALVVRDGISSCSSELPEFSDSVASTAPSVTAAITTTAAAAMTSLYFHDRHSSFFGFDSLLQDEVGDRVAAEDSRNPGVAEARIMGLLCTTSPCLGDPSGL